MKLLMSAYGPKRTSHPGVKFALFAVMTTLIR
jgi:hypothetical protein